MREPGAEGGSAVPVILSGFVHRWARAIIGTSYVSLPAHEVEDVLRAHTEALLAALLGDPFVTTAAQQVGAALVAAHFTGTEALSRTVALLPDLAPYAGGDSPRLRQRVAALQGALAAGYAQALQDRTLTEQEEIRRAATVALGQAADALRTSETRLHAVFAGSSLAMGIGDADGHMVQANPALAALVGTRPAELLDLSIADLFHPGDADRMGAAYRELLAGDQVRVRGHHRLIRHGGDPVRVFVGMVRVRPAEGTRPHVLLLLADDAPPVERPRDAGADPLTRLPNRAVLADRMTEAFTDALPDARVGVCVLDIDGFTPINDRWGRAVGDGLLVTVADLLVQRVSGGRHLVARVGGDEFVVLVTGSSGTEELVALGAAARAVLDGPVVVGGHALQVSASAGIAERAVTATTPADLLRAAEVALYWAKSHGSGRSVLFDPDRDTREVRQEDMAR